MIIIYKRCHFVVSFSITIYFLKQFLFLISKLTCVILKYELNNILCMYICIIYVCMCDVAIIFSHLNLFHLRLVLLCF